MVGNKLKAATKNSGQAVQYFSVGSTPIKATTFNYKPLNTDWCRAGAGVRFEPSRSKMAQTHINAIAFKEGEIRVAQGIEYDIVAHTNDQTPEAQVILSANAPNKTIQ
jgi:hypothetical protein